MIKIKFLARQFLYYKFKFGFATLTLRKGKDPNPELDPFLWPMDPDADPGGPKTYGSYWTGFVTLISGLF